MTAAPRLQPARLLPAVLLLAAALLAGCADTDAPVTYLVAEFGDPGARDGFSVEVASHLDTRPTQEMYDRDGIPHPDGYTVHDQLEEWSRQTGRSYATTSYPDTGFGAGYFLTGLDGVNADGTSAYWSLSINGEPSSVGMSQAVLAEGDTVTWTLTTTNGAASSAGTATLQVDPVAPTQADSAVLRGTVAGPTTLQVMRSNAYLDESGRQVIGDAISYTTQVEADGAWEVTVPLDIGGNAFEVFEPDGAYASLTIVRLASATFEAIYTASPDHEATTDTVWYNPLVLSSKPLYAGTDADRAASYSVHDLMVDWTAQTGTPIEYGGPGAFGFSVNRIDGVGQPLDSSLPPYWCYVVNGEAADVGISLQTVRPGDVVTWEYSTCV